MKKFRKLSILLVFTMFVSLFTGCTMNEKNLADAFLKGQEILSFESITNLEFELSSDGLEEDEQLIFDMVADTVNDLSINMLQRSVSNEDQTTAKGYIDLKVKLGEESHDASIWVDVDMAGEELTLKEVFKLPSIVNELLPAEVSGKKYIVLDLDEMMEVFADLEGEGLDESVDFNEIMAIAMSYQEKFVESINNYIKNYNSKLSLVTRLQDKTVDGEALSVYQVKFDNDSFKEFLKYNIINMLKDKETIQLFTDYMSEVFALTGEEMPEEMDITKDIPKLIESVKDFFDKIEKLNILGEEGIVINYGVNKDGFMVSEEGKIDLSIDIENIMSIISDELEEELETMPVPVFNLGISYDTKISKINKDMKIIIPETTSKNSVSYMEIIKTIAESVVPEEGQDQPTLIIVEDDLIELSSEPLTINGRVNVPSRDIAGALGAEIAWNGDTQQITVSKDNTVLVLNVDSNEATINGEKVLLDSKITVVDGTGFVPLRFAAESFGYEVEWDPMGLIFINKK